MSAPLLEFAYANQKNPDEKDLKARSTKKVKGKDIELRLGKNDMFVNQGVSSVSYKAMVLEEFSMTREGTPRKETEEENLDEFEELKVEEHKFGDYECPEIILSGKEEHKIYVPWKKGSL
ncbi:unnamed protein product [Lathyrus oleraceus]